MTETTAETSSTDKEVIWDAFKPAEFVCSGKLQSGGRVINVIRILVLVTQHTVKCKGYVSQLYEKSPENSF